MPEQLNQEMGAIEEGEVQPTFIEEMLKLVNKDFTNAKQFLYSFHRTCIENYKRYFNASRYTDLDKENRFPHPFFQEQMDTFVSYMMDKLFYKNQPCTIVGVEDSDQLDAEAKQEMIAWQDYKDKIYTKIEKLLHDIARCRIGVAQIDYVKRTKNQIVGIEEPEMAFSVWRMGMAPTGNMVSRTEVQPVVLYEGPSIKRIDPTDFFITQDKSEIDDEHPVMIRSRHSLDYFYSQDYFFNQERIVTDAGEGVSDDSGTAEVSESRQNKAMVHDLRPETSHHSKMYEYIEWQGMANKRKLYQYSKLPFEQIGKREKVWTICGMVNNKVIVRLEESPFDVEGPNVIVGVMQSDEDELIGTSLADKITAVAQSLDKLMGMFLANMKQSVNMMHVINMNATKTGAQALVNKPGFVLEATDDVNHVHKTIMPVPISKDLYATIDQMFPQMGRDAGGNQKILGGQGEPFSETLGETELVAASATLRMTDYLRSIEESLIIPMYNLRNQINMQFLDQEYVYGIIGEGAVKWRRIPPEKIRANVDFICESASRETNRLVITQQIIQMVQVAPQLAQMGMPMRIDKLVGKLCEQGFSWNKKECEDILPTLRLERTNINLDEMLLENMLLQLNVQKIMTMMAPAQAAQESANAGAPAKGKNPDKQAESKSVGDANRTSVGREQ